MKEFNLVAMSIQKQLHPPMESLEKLWVLGGEGLHRRLAVVTLGRGRLARAADLWPHILLLFILL